MNAVSIRGDWVGRLIDGRFPLLEWLGGSGTTGVFLTESEGPGSAKAAIKLIPAAAGTEHLIAGWSSYRSLAHPHLMRTLHFGRAEDDGLALIYILTDLAEEVLAEIIPARSLSADEARQMLEPILDALEYLHGGGLAHGGIKPSNIFVVENEIRISSDALLPIGEPALHLLSNDIHVAPELSNHPVEPSADIWSLGVTLVEALTQQPPIWDIADHSAPVIPAAIDEPFASIARGCLHPDPSLRISLTQIRERLTGRPESKPAGPVIPAPAPEPTPVAPDDAAVPFKIPFQPVLAGFLLLIAIGAALVWRNHSATPPPVHEEVPSASEAGAAPPPASSGSPAPVPAASNSPGEPVDRAVPDVPSSASHTIQGKVRVVVRVNVDAQGTVTAAEFVTRGPSAYFARLALDSAGRWRFRAPQVGGRAVPSTWLLGYQFRRDNVDVTPTQTSPP